MRENDLNMKTAKPAVALSEWFSQTGYPLYLVGGYVRNTLLGLPPTDMDICAAVPAQRVAQIQTDEICVKEHLYGLGTLMIVQQCGKEQYTYEYTAFRSDNYGRGGLHRPKSVCFTEDIKEDARRRDFTVNALYCRAEGGMAEDPLGMGIADLQKKCLRMTREESMQEDALRILRMVRLAAELGFEIEPKTFAAAKENVRNLENISKERVREELFRLLLADARYGRDGAVLRGLHLLEEVGALTFVLPELLAGDGFAQTPRYHKYDVMEHSFRTCDAAPPELPVRLAALLHDVAKPAAFAAEGKLYCHPQMGAQVAGRALERLKAEKALTQAVCELIEAHMFDLENDAGKKAVAKMAVRLGKPQFLRLADLREADFAGSGMGNVAKSAVKWRNTVQEMEREHAPFTLEELAVDGNDLIKELQIPPGPAVGALLKSLQEIALKKPSQNNYKSLIRYAKIITTGRTGGGNVSQCGLPEDGGKKGV